MLFSTSISQLLPSRTKILAMSLDADVEFASVE